MTLTALNKQSMEITVVLCTYNRCGTLVRALESVAASIVADGIDWEILVVDNNSTDRTRDVVMDFSNKHPNRVRYLFEPQPGKSHALNLGIREARGAVLAFMDDDVRVEPTWLQNLTASLRDGGWVGSGGRIVPEWSSPVPSWLYIKSRYALAPLVHFDLGEIAGELREPPFGTNMAFRKRCLKNTVVFERTWVLVPEARYAVRTVNSPYDCWGGASGCGMNLPLLYITRCRKIV